MWYLVFHFYFSQNIFLFPFIFLLCNVYLKSSLLNFHIFVSFLIFLLLQIYSLIPLWLKKGTNYFNLFKFDRVYFVT